MESGPHNWADHRQELDADVAQHGGAARFDMDDGYVIGPPGAVFPAVARFAERIRALGLELQLGSHRLPSLLLSFLVRC